MKQASICQTQRENHFDICTTLDVSTENYYEDGSAEHSGLELCFTLDESLHHRKFRNHTHMLPPGKLMVFNARERHTEECSKNPTVRRLRTVIINPSFVDEIFKDLELRSDELVFDDFLINPSEKMDQLLASVFCFKNTPRVSSVVFDCLMTDIVIELVTKVRNKYSSKIETCYKTGYFPTNFEKAKEIMRESACSDKLDLETIARNSGLSKFHFVREFKRNVGVSPIRYLNQLKIDMAKQMLISSNATVTDVAMGMGYSDLSTFNKSFKKFSNLTPSEYRTLHARKTAIFS